MDWKGSRFLQYAQHGLSRSNRNGQRGDGNEWGLLVAGTPTIPQKAR